VYLVLYLRHEKANLIPQRKHLSQKIKCGCFRILHFLVVAFFYLRRRLLDFSSPVLLLLEKRLSPAYKLAGLLFVAEAQIGRSGISSASVPTLVFVCRESVET